MQIYEELQARGLIAQVTDEPQIKKLLNSGGAKFYIGFDPTADSLHVGHFMALCLMKQLRSTMQTGCWILIISIFSGMWEHASRSIRCSVPNAISREWSAV